MKKLIITLMALLIAVPCFAKEYRVKADFLLLNENHAIALYNFLEANKDKIYQPEVNENGSYEIPTYVCFIDSWDTDNPPKPGFTRTCIDFEKPSQTWTAIDTSIPALQAVVDDWDAKLAEKQAELDKKKAALQVKKDELQALIDAQ